MEIERSSNGTEINRKIGNVLQKILEPNFKIENDFYLNQFLTQLISKNDTKIWQDDKQLQEYFCQWIIQIVNVWEKDKVKPKAIILSFVLNLASQLSVNDNLFARLNCQDVYKHLIEMVQTNLTKEPSVTLGMVTLLYSFLEHKSGLQWIIATTQWNNMISLGLKARKMGVRKKVYQFVIKLLELTICDNRNFAVDLVDILIKPLRTVFRSVASNTDPQNIEIENKDPLQFLKHDFTGNFKNPNVLIYSKPAATTETLLKKDNKKVMQLFSELEIPELIERIFLLSQKEDLSFVLLKIQFVFLLYHMSEKLNGIKVIAFGSLKLFEVRLMIDLIQYQIEKNYVRCVIKICDYAYRLFCCLESRMPKVIKNGIIIEFQTEMMFLQMGPLIAVQSQLISDEKAVMLLESDDFRNAYYKKCLKICSPQTIKVCYKWAEILQPNRDLFDDCIFCLKYLVKLKNLLNKDRAAHVFSILIYNLDDTLHFFDDNPDYEHISSCLPYFNILVQTAVDYVESFDLTWTDSMETVLVLDLVFKIFEYRDWNNYIITVNGLKLLNTAISKGLSPDMALLIDYVEDSRMIQTGSLLHDMCHDSVWEIREMALKVVCTLSLNANTKFPAYTTILLNAELPQLVEYMALKDSEYHVRATAFKCLQELIQMPDVWDTLLNMDKFLDNIFDVFENETEGIVRKEAAILISKIDKYQAFPEETLPRLYDVMTHAAIGDIHGEVKLNALDFWFNLWEKLLTHEGMLDHTFPSHTFSKERKKIIVLDEEEVRKRILKVLNLLSDIGCLHVMKCAVQDDYDIEVSKKATSFTFSMLKMFKLFKISGENVDLSRPASTTTLSSPYAVTVPITTENLGSCQDIPLSNTSPNHTTSNLFCDSDVDVFDYDGITCDTKLEPVVRPSSPEPVRADLVLGELNSNDLQLLQEICNHAQMITRTYLAPSAYLNFVYDEVETHAMKKTQWLHTKDEFDLLLDDILREYNIVPDVGSMSS